MKIYRTPKQEKRWKRDLAIYTEFEEAMSNPLNSATAVAEYLMKKYGVNSTTMILLIRKRVEKTLKLMNDENDENNLKVVEKA